jgi:hypothetical protein
MKIKKFFLDYDNKIKNASYLVNNFENAVNRKSHYLHNRVGASNMLEGSKDIHLTKKKITLKQLIGRIVDED